MPGQGDIGGGSCDLNFTVNDASSNKKHSWYCKDRDCGRNPTLEIWVGPNGTPKPAGPPITLGRGQLYNVGLDRNFKAFFEWDDLPSARPKRPKRPKRRKR